MRVGVAFLLIAFFAVTAAEKARYDNYQVYRVTPRSAEQVKMLHDLEHATTQFSFWRESGRVNDPADILVPPHKRPMFHDMIKASGLESVLHVPNVQALFNEEAARLMTKGTGKAVDWKDYNTLTEIYDWLDQLAAANPNVKVVNAGKTYEGRELRGLEITNGEGLPGVIFESGIHAREWIAPAATSWIINQIINSPANSIYRQFNYLYFPVVNPDGYEYTWKTDRAWRKTRVPYIFSGILICYGADPNRNWDYHWLEGGSSTDPCSETYAGPKPFSDPEVKNLANYFTSVSSKYDIYIAFHSYSQLLMYPWGYTGADTPLEATWKRIGNAAAADLKAVHGTSFDVGSIYDTIYQTSGSSIEWYYGLYNSTLTFTFELRDQGNYGFTLPADQIIPSGEELIQAINRILSEYQKLPKKQLAPQ